MFVYVVNCYAEHLHFAEQCRESGGVELLTPCRQHLVLGIVGEEVAHAAFREYDVVLLKIFKRLQDSMGVHGHLHCQLAHRGYFRLGEPLAGYDAIERVVNDLPVYGFVVVEIHIYS